MVAKRWVTCNTTSLLNSCMYKKGRYKIYLTLKTDINSLHVESFKPIRYALAIGSSKFQEEQ